MALSKHLDSSHRAAWDRDFAHLLKVEIPRYQRSYATWFPPQLEDRYNRDTREGRSHNVKFTMLLGTCLYFLTALTDFAFLPDIGFDGLYLRLIALPPLLACPYVASHWRSRPRELYLTATGLTVVTVLAFIPLLSASPLAPLAYTSAMLAVVYGNTTVQGRFPLACFVTVFSCVLISSLAMLQSPIGWAVTIEALIAGLLSLIANYQMERRARLTYLLLAREEQRIAALDADRALLRAISDTDELTGVPNRGAFNRYCAAAFANPANEGVQVAVLMIDVDHFKPFNDHYGHIAGDACLRTIAETLASTIRRSDDVVARYGGEEFIAFLFNISPVQAELLAGRLCREVQELEFAHAARSDGLRQITISVGISTTTIGSKTSLRDLIAAADRALYAAKRKGRNRVEARVPEAA